MNKHIAFIDPFIKNPSVHCYNAFVERFSIPLTYHMPAALGMEELLKSREGIKGYIVIGSASNVTEPLDWHQPLGEFLLAELLAEKPVLGCCFGHQLLCHMLGSHIEYASSNEEKISGVRSIKITEDFWNFKQNEIFTLGITHRQVVRRLGPGLRSVGEGLPNDIVIHDTLPLLTTQAHPEASRFFCSFDIPLSDPNHIELAYHDGGKLIARFLEYYKLNAVKE